VGKLAPLPDRIDNFTAFLTEPLAKDAAYALPRRAETLDRPLGDESWIKKPGTGARQNADATETWAKSSGDCKADQRRLIEQTVRLIPTSHNSRESGSWAGNNSPARTAVRSPPARRPGGYRHFTGANREFGLAFARALVDMER